MKKQTTASANITQKDLQAALDDLYFRLADKVDSKIDDKIDNLRTEIKIDHRKYHYENMAKFDKVMGELATFRDENIIGTYHTRELREEVEGHEKRIRKIEKAQSTS